MHWCLAADSALPLHRYDLESFQLSGCDFKLYISTIDFFKSQSKLGDSGIALGRQRQAYFSKFKASQLYKESSKTAKTVKQKSLALKKKKKKTNFIILLKYLDTA